MRKGRAPCCEKIGLRKGSWTAVEDKKLVSYIEKHGHGNWRALPKHAGLLRCGKSCRLRWINYLRPDIKLGNFTKEEEETILKLHGLLGNKWSKIASNLPGRTDNEIKNFWNTHLKKRLTPKEQSCSTNKTKALTGSPSPSSSLSSSCANQGGGKRAISASHMDSIRDPHLEEPENPIELDLDLWCMLEESSPHLPEETSKEDLVTWDAQLAEVLVCEGLNDWQDSSIAHTRESYKVKEEMNKEAIETPKIIVESELWSFIDNDSCLFTYEMRPKVEDKDHRNPTSLQVDSTKVESNIWLNFLEKEIDLWEAMDGSQSPVTVRETFEQLSTGRSLMK